MSDLSEKLAAIEARLAATTPGPWTLSRYDHCGGRAYVEAPKRVLVCDAFNERDREFLFNAPEDVEFLLALVRDQAAKLAKVEALCENADDTAITEADGEHVPVHLIRAALGDEA